MRDDLTEEQAGKKRCPMPMGVMNDQRTQNHCIASACMAWRWTDGYFETVTMDNRCIDEKMTRERGMKWIGHTDQNPPHPAGDGWEPMGEPRQADGFVEGVLQQTWRRPKGFRHGACGAFR